MLRKLKLEEIEKAANLAYSLSLSPSTNSYTLRGSQKEYLDSFTKAINNPDDTLLGYFIGNELVAVIDFFILKKDLYLQTTALFIRVEVETVFSEFLDYLNDNYTGYEVYIGYPQENEKAINYLLNHDFKIIESSIDQRLSRFDFVPSELKHSIIKISHHNYSDFATFHDLKVIDVYWNSKRIKEHFNDWVIYSYWENSQIKASINARIVKDMVEIFDLSIDKDYTYKGIEEDLITSTLKEAFQNPTIEDAVFFIDSDDEYTRAYSKKIGFTVHSNYRLLYIKL